MTTTAQAGADSRRMHLLAVLRSVGGTVTTGRALAIYAASREWHNTGRNAARRDLRDLARRAYLVPVEHNGARLYELGSNPRPAHPGRGIRKFVLEVIQTEGGEWTTGRVKRTWRQLLGTHVLRMSVRRYLAALHRYGYLDRHGEGTSRRFYTVRRDDA